MAIQKNDPNCFIRAASQGVCLVEMALKEGAEAPQLAVPGMGGECIDGVSYTYTVVIWWFWWTDGGLKHAPSSTEKNHRIASRTAQ